MHGQPRFKVEKNTSSLDEDGGPMARVQPRIPLVRLRQEESSLHSTPTDLPFSSWTASQHLASSISPHDARVCYLSPAGAICVGQDDSTANRSPGKVVYAMKECVGSWN
jgi:hypothetical protein